MSYPRIGLSTLLQNCVSRLTVQSRKVFLTKKKPHIVPDPDYFDRQTFDSQYSILLI